jgi:hypothetical protein
MAVRRSRGPGLGTLLVLAALGVLGYRYGPQLLERIGLKSSGPVVQWGQAHEADGLRLSIASAELTFTVFEDNLGAREGKRDLQVTLDIANVDPQRAATYHPAILLRADEPELVDNRGRAVPRANYGDQAWIDGQLRRGDEIAAGESEQHLLLFRAPEADIEYLVLTVDLALFSRKGTARLKIPADKIRGLK